MNPSKSKAANMKKNMQLMIRRAVAVPRGIGNAHQIFVAGALNSEILDVERNRYIDFCAWIQAPRTVCC